MIVLKTRRELDLMREACRISANALREAGKAVEPGVSTQEIDDVVRNYIRKQGASPSFLGYGGFPASACISVNNVVIHGIPSKKQILKSGDIVSVDVGAAFTATMPTHMPAEIFQRKQERCSMLQRKAFTKA